ncbi:hypothetical protein ACROYT_G031131 [Oculina patagonica]
MADLQSVELIEFFRPYKNEINLYVTNISRRLEKETVQVKLLDIFSQFGLVYEVQVIDSSDSLEAPEESSVNCMDLNYSSLYAFVKFYSARAARRAKEGVSGKRLLGGQFLKVQFAQRKKFTEVVQHPLYMAKCTVLANYYFGFNGWSTKIVQMERLENKTDNCDSQEKNNALLRCVVRLEIKDCEFFCDGTGYGGDRNTLQQEKDPTKRLELLEYAKKLAHRHAYENAFRRVIIISLDNGKVGVEINQQDVPECNFDEPGSEEGIVHVNLIEEMPASDSDEEDKALDLELQNLSSSSLDLNDDVG